MADDTDTILRPSSSDFVAILTAFFALVGTCFTAFLGFKMAELSSRTNQVALQNVQVSQKLTDVAAETSVVKITTLKTKDYVNHLMELQLALNARTTRKLADISKNEADEVVAAKAEKDFQDHVDEKKRVEDKERNTQIIVPGKVVPPGVAVLPGVAP